MPHDLIGWLRIVDIVGLALVAVRLLGSGLVRAYPALFAHATLETLFAAASFAVPSSGIAYAWMFILFSPTRWAIWCIIVWSLYRSALGKYPALLTVGRSVLGAALVLALLPIAFTLKFDFAHVGPQVAMLPAIFLGERTVTAALALFVLALCSLLAWFFVPTKRNCAYLCMGLGLLFATRSAAFSARNALGPAVSHVVNIAELIGSSGVFLAWAILLNPAGEERTAFVGRRRGPADPVKSIRALAELSSHLQPKGVRDPHDQV